MSVSASVAGVVGGNSSCWDNDGRGWGGGGASRHCETVRGQPSVYPRGLRDVRRESGYKFIFRQT